eukprot:2862967-Amphidinium_carterae.1
MLASVVVLANAKRKALIKTDLSTGHVEVLVAEAAEDEDGIRGWLLMRHSIAVQLSLPRLEVFHAGVNLQTQTWSTWTIGLQRPASTRTYPKPHQRASR